MEHGRGTHQKVGKYSIGSKTVMFTVNIFFCPNCRKVLGVSKVVYLGILLTLKFAKVKIYFI